MLLCWGRLGRGDNAKQAIDQHCEIIGEPGGNLQASKPLSEHPANPELAGWIWAEVDVSVEKKQSYTNISIELV
jgi:hypothetical protein